MKKKKKNGGCENKFYLFIKYKLKNFHCLKHRQKRIKGSIDCDPEDSGRNSSEGKTNNLSRSQRNGARGLVGTQVGIRRKNAAHSGSKTRIG